MLAFFSFRLKFLARKNFESPLKFLGKISKTICIRCSSKKIPAFKVESLAKCHLKKIFSPKSELQGILAFSPGPKKLSGPDDYARSCEIFTKSMNDRFKLENLRKRNLIFCMYNQVKIIRLPRLSTMLVELRCDKNYVWLLLQNYIELELCKFLKFIFRKHL